jgi:hypothetical protein
MISAIHGASRARCQARPKRSPEHRDAAVFRFAPSARDSSRRLHLFFDAAAPSSSARGLLKRRRMTRYVPTIILVAAVVGCGDATPSGIPGGSSTPACTTCGGGGGSGDVPPGGGDGTNDASAPSPDAGAPSLDSGGGASDSGTVAHDASSDASEAGGGNAPIGCNGAPGCAEWTKVYQTWYGFNDNSCGVENIHSCNDIAYPGYGPQKHKVATEGKGTFDDPITAAAADNGCESSGGATLVPGTIIYNPEVHKYFIMEDSCLECTQECNCQSGADGTPPAGCTKNQYRHIDFWMGPNDTAQNATALNNCEDKLTLGDPYKGPGTVIINPPANLPVDTAPLYINNACTAHTYPDPP